MDLTTAKIVKQVKRLYREYETRDAGLLARYLGITVVRRRFKRQKGAYIVIERNPFVFIKRNLPPILYKIVLLHEIGHDRNHKTEAIKVGGFREFDIFGMQANQMEREANLFASEMSLPNDEVLELIEMNYTIEQIAGTLESEPNLVAIKIDTLIEQGYRFRPVEHNNNFLNSRY